jgi:hypothetical protein
MGEAGLEATSGSSPLKKEGDRQPAQRNAPGWRVAAQNEASPPWLEPTTAALSGSVG